MSKLRISSNLSLPEEAVTRSFGMLGMRGSGKSNAAVVMAEEMFAAGLQWVAIDPKGDWFGIRASKDGKASGGLPVVIFGGEHADVPLEPTAKAGVLVADLIVNEGVTCILDLSNFSKAQKIQLLAGSGSQEGFAGHLFRTKKQNQDPIHVFLEEAHDYVPQQARGELGKLIDVVSSLQTMGRTKGLGCSIISQRSARVHKDVLTQVDTLLAFRTIGPQDRKAIEQWVKYHGLAEELVASLSELADGECWIWSPEWLRTLKRVQLRRRETFDSGATPVRGASKRTPATLADVDLKAIEQAMAATIERAKADDPKELRKRIAELERQLRARPVGEPEVVEKVVEVEKVVPVEVPLFDEAMLRRMEKALDPAVGLLGELQELALKHRMAAERRLYAPKPPANRSSGRTATRDKPRHEIAKSQATPGKTLSAARTPKRTITSVDSDELTRPQQRVLDALAWLEAMGFPEGNRIQVAFLAGYSPGTGHYTNTLGGLRSAGLIDYPSTGSIALTEQGQSLAEPIDIPASTEALHEAVLTKLKGPQARLLKVLIDTYPEALSREELAAATGYSVGTGHFTNTLGSLRSLGLVDYPSAGYVAALPVLFLEVG